MSCKPIFTWGWILAAALLFNANAAPAADPAPDSLDSLKKEIQSLKDELTRLRAENADLKRKLQDKDNSATTKPKIADGEIKFELGDEKTIGGYKYRSPAGWVAQSVKGNNTGITYLSPDKAHAILLIIRLKGGAPAEMQNKFTDSVLQMQKQQLAKSKTVIVDPTVSLNDPRFYCRLRERVKVDQRTAEQHHLYRNYNKDMIEVTAITTAEDTETAARLVKLAEDLTLGVKPEK